MASLTFARVPKISVKLGLLIIDILILINKSLINESLVAFEYGNEWKLVSDELLFMLT